MRAIQLRKVIVVSLSVFFTIIFIDIEISVAQTSGPDIVSGLQAYWKFDEGSDTKAKDMSGNHVNGTLHSNASWTSQGKFNNALSINNGTNGYVNFGTSSLQLTSELTISLWVYRQGNSGSYTEALISRSQYGYPFIIQLQNSGYVSTFLRGSGSSYVVSNTRLQNSTWNHIVMTYKSGERVICINGNIDKTDTAVTGSLLTSSGGAPANIRIGSNGTGSNSFWGMVDEVRIYNRALSAEEITALYDGTGLDITPPLPVSIVNDGTGNDMASTASTNTLSANWTASSDPQSKVVRYYYAIGTTPGGADVVDWTNNQMNLSVLQRGLDLTIGATYYTTVEAENSSGLKSIPVSSNGIHVVNIQYSNLVAQDSGYRRNNPIDVVNYPQNLPPFSEIVNKPLWDVPTAGVFTWRDAWDDWPINNNSFINEMHQVGWQSIRVGSYYYEMLTDKEMHNLVMAARNDNIKTMFSMCGKQRYQTGEFATDQEWINSYLVFVDSMIGRFGPNGKYFQDYPSEPYEPIMYWEIWNEPRDYYMLGEDHSADLTFDQKADLYGRLLLASYNHIRSKQEWNDIKIVAMSSVGTQDDIPDFIDKVHIAVQSNGGNPAQCYDIVSIHPYTQDCPPDVEDIITSDGVSINYTFSLITETAIAREVMAKWGNTGKPLWYTEVGWSRDYPNLNMRNPVTDNQQAAYVCRLYATAMRIGVDQVHIMFIYNGDGYNSGFLNTQGHVWYKSAYAAQNFIRLMPVPKIISAISDGDLGYYAYSINPNVDDPNAEPVVMAWNALGPMTVNFPVDPSSNYLLFDMLGDSVIISPQNGQLEIPIGPYPVYVVKGISVPSYAIVKPPEELKIDSVTANLVSLSWIASTSSGIAGYTILRDGVVRATTAGTTYNDTDISQDTAYSYSMKAYTTSNVSSRPSNEVRVKTLRTTDTTVKHRTVPVEFAVSQNYPNPFNPSTKIQFVVPSDGHVRIRVYNCLGQIVATPFEGEAKAGQYQTVQIDGMSLSSGVYFYSIEHKGQRIVKQMVMIK